MTIPSTSSYATWPMVRRLCQFLFALDGGLSRETLQTLANTSWDPSPQLTIWEPDDLRPRAALLAFPDAKLFFMCGIGTAFQAWALISGYDHSAGRIPESVDDNTYFGYTLLNWWIDQVKPLFDLGGGNKVLCGHSGGGAFCADLVWRQYLDNAFLPNYVTFGAPKPFGRRAAAAIDQRPCGMRMMLPNDPVPQVYPILGEPLSLIFPNLSAVVWQHPSNDGIILNESGLTSGYYPPNLSILPGLDLGTWLWNMENNPAHSMTAYQSRIFTLSQNAENALVDQAAPVVDQDMMPRTRENPFLPPNNVPPPPVQVERQREQRRREFVASETPIVQAIKVFTWKRSGRRYNVLCNGRVIAGGYKRHNAAATARAGNELIIRLLSQSLTLDPVSLDAALQDYWTVLDDPNSDLYPLIVELRRPLAIG